MLQNANKLLLLLLMLVVASPVLAQDITSVRDINAIPDSQITTLQTSAENLTGGDISANIFNETFGTTVTIVVVLTSDPRNSGLAGLDDAGQPDRVHMFGRDTSSVSLGNEGMGIQIVDGAYATNNLLSFGLGEVVKITGTIDAFQTVMQISPETIEFLGLYSDLGLPDSILDPVVVTTDQLNSAVGTEDGVQTNWANWSDYRAQFVRLEGVTLQNRLLNNPDRPDFYVSSDDGTTVLNFYDTGLQFRNDRDDYPSTFNNSDISMLDDFTPPPPGSVLNLQGYLLMQPFADQIGRSVPDHGLVSIVPFERRGCEDETSNFRCDLEVTETPPSFTSLIGPTSVPDGSEGVTISFTVEADPSRTIDSASCTYTTSEDATEQTVDASLNGDAYECVIPAQGDGVFTLYQASATDNTGAEALSETEEYRTLVDGIDSISDVQATIDEGRGSSPFDGFDAVAMNIIATVQSDPGTSGFIVLQDNADLDAWTGITLFESETALERGDIIEITEADISEFRGATQLGNATYTVMSSGNETLGYKTVTTDVLLDEAIAEAHEGMMLQFDNVTITTQNADNPDDNTAANFGEWGISSDGTVENQLRVDDGSDALASDPEPFDGVPAGVNFEVINRWGVYSFHRGFLSESFGNFKLIPESIEDLGEVTNVANETGDLPSKFSLEQNFPNPFNPTTSITYAVPATGHVTLEVYDLLGRTVKVLVNGVVTVGEYTHQFDAADLPSGMYLYRFTAGNQTSTRKMLLLK
ncbi:MAG: T9SS type A sorting domain-containing protein [Rhodothermales bacterium]